MQPTLSEPRDPWVGNVLSRGIPEELVITVRKDGVLLQAGAKLIYDRQGDRSRRTRPRKQLDAPLSLFGWGPGAMPFHKIVLEPLGAERGKPLVESDP